jgi:hypothetical protein
LFSGVTALDRSANRLQTYGLRTRLAMRTAAVSCMSGRESV